MFVRAKKIKNKSYAYLVKNVWVKGKVKQKSNKYLGKIVDLDELKINNSFEDDHFKIDFDGSSKDVLINVLKKHFYSFGFKDHPRQNAVFFNDVIVNFSSRKILERGKKIVLKMNNRFFYSVTLNDFLDFYEPESEEDVKGKKLAQFLSDAGVSISNDDFIRLYKKLYLDFS